MSEWNGIFDQGFSGILDDGDPKLPNYLDGLAEKEASNEYKEAEADTDLLFSKERIGLSRAEDLSDASTRTVENKKVEAKDYRKEIEKEVEKMLAVGTEPTAIEKTLNRKFPKNQVKKYFEANASNMLQKYGEVALQYLNKKSYKDCKEIEDVLRDHRSQLKTKSAIQVCSSFCDWVRNHKKSEQRTIDNRVAFRRDIDEKEILMRDLENNDARNAKIKEEKEYDSIWAEFSKHVNSGYNQKEAHAKLLETYEPTKLDNFYNKYAKSIDKLVKFAQRQTVENPFSKVDNSATVRDFEFENKKQSSKEEILKDAESLFATASSLDSVIRTLEGKHGDIDYLKSIIATKRKRFVQKAKKEEKQDSYLNQVPNTATTRNDKIENRANYNEKKMLNVAFNMMSNGKTFEEIENVLKKRFSYDNAVRFLKENKTKLAKHYGQLGQIFIDSNIYSDCDTMKKSYCNMNHFGEKLIHVVKANKKCKGCVENKQGTCQKVGLLLSNHPLVRSPRAAKKVIKRAQSFAPKTYVDEYLSKVSSDSNLELISEFTLGLRKACLEEKKNIGKKASVGDNSKDAQEGFVAPETYDVDLFNKSVSSYIVNDVLNGGKDNG